ncbi:MAG: DUF6115 domain-containing protein [Bacillota bacterium]
MQAGEVIFIVLLNCLVIIVCYIFQKKSLQKHIKHLKTEVQDLEDLVAAIIEEFEEIAEQNAAEIHPRNNTIEVSPLPESNRETPANRQSNDVETETNDEPDPLTTDIPSANQIYTEIKSSSPVNPKPAIEPLRSTGKRLVNDPRHQRVLELWDQGVSVEEIAKQLGTGRGEIQLVLGIYRRS